MTQSALNINLEASLSRVEARVGGVDDRLRNTEVRVRDIYTTGKVVAAIFTAAITLFGVWTGFLASETKSNNTNVSEVKDIVAETNAALRGASNDIAALQAENPLVPSIQFGSVDSSQLVVSPDDIERDSDSEEEQFFVDFSVVLPRPFPTDFEVVVDVRSITSSDEVNSAEVIETSGKEFTLRVKYNDVSRFSSSGRLGAFSISWIAYGQPIVAR